MSRSWVSNAAWVISVFVPFRLSLFSAVSFLLPIPLLLLLQDQAKISQSRLSFGELSFTICSEAMWIDLASLIEGYVLDQDHLTFFWHLLTPRFWTSLTWWAYKEPLFHPFPSHQQFASVRWLSFFVLSKSETGDFARSLRAWKQSASLTWVHQPQRSVRSPVDHTSPVWSTRASLL